MSLPDEHERLVLWWPLIGEYAYSNREWLAGVVQVYSHEPETGISQGLAFAMLDEIEKVADSAERSALLEEFRVAFTTDDWLMRKARDTELVLLAITGDFFDPTLATTSAVQARIMAYPCNRVVLEYFAEHGITRYVRHLARQCLRKLTTGESTENPRSG